MARRRPWAAGNTRNTSERTSQFTPYWGKKRCPSACRQSNGGRESTLQCTLTQRLTLCLLCSLCKVKRVTMVTNGVYSGFSLYSSQTGSTSTKKATTMASTATEPDRGLNSAFFFTSQVLTRRWLVGSGGGRQGKGSRAG